MATKTLDTGQDKIEKIATLLRRQTLEPAEAEAQHLIETARADAAIIIKKAQEEAQGLLSVARVEVERLQRVFHSSLSQASEQALESLRQSVEKLFNAELDLETARASADPKLIARLIEAIVETIQREGASAELTATVAKAVTPQQIFALLSAQVVKKLQEREIGIGEFAGGARVRLHDRQFTLDVSDVALRDLLKRYVRRDFRKLLFGEE